MDLPFEDDVRRSPEKEEYIEKEESAKKESAKKEESISGGSQWFNLRKLKEESISGGSQ